jgi:hypothetical protein
MCVATMVDLHLEFAGWIVTFGYPFLVLTFLIKKIDIDRSESEKIARTTLCRPLHNYLSFDWTPAKLSFSSSESCYLAPTIQYGALPPPA